MSIHQDLLNEFHDRHLRLAEIRVCFEKMLGSVHKSQKIIKEMLDEGSSIDPSTLREWLAGFAYGQEQLELLLEKMREMK